MHISKKKPMTNARRSVAASTNSLYALMNAKSAVTASPSTGSSIRIATSAPATAPSARKTTRSAYDAATGEKLGQWVLPRPQLEEENCTVHNYNIVPLRSGRYVAVSGNYQAGTWVTDFTDPANPVALAWSDPPPLPQVTTPTGATVNELGGAWSTYWYNGFLYESDITTGLNVFRVAHPSLAGEIRLPSLNPQTSEFSLP